MRFFSVLVVGSSVALGAAACQKDNNNNNKETRAPAADLGEPIGAELEARGNVPALSLAFAVTRGQDPVPLLPKLVSAVSAAAGNCPAFVAESSADAVMPLAFTTEGGRLKTAPRADASPGLKCVASALDGKEIGATTALDGRIEMKLGAPPAPAKKP